jgi:SulP family sulfate permease
MFGLGLTIIVGQLPKLLGVPAGQGDFFGQAGDLLGRLGDVDLWTAAIGLGSLAVLLGLKRVAPACPRPCWWSWAGSRWWPWPT